MKARFFKPLDLNREYGAIPDTRHSVVNTLKNVLSNPVLQGRSFFQVRKSKFQELLELLDQAHRDAVISNNFTFLEKVHKNIMTSLQRQLDFGLVPQQLQDKLNQTARYIESCTLRNQKALGYDRPQLRL
jgi:hypothetical protein